MEIAAIGFPETLVGFKLAGLRLTVECNRDNADAKLNESLDNPDVGLIILDQELASSLSLKTKRKVEASTRPVVVFIPGRKGVVEGGGESISAMVKRAIGIELKVK